MTKKNPSQAINTNDAFIAGADMSSREAEILQHIVSTSNFKPKEVIWRSSYFGTSAIGAVHYKGEFESQEAVLKIQGVKPDISEIYMIEQFALQNRSKFVRPPRLFHTIPWEDKNGYEALIMEHVSGPKVLEGKRLQSKDAIHRFFEIYQEYKRNCIPTKPWLPRPEKPNFKEILEKIIASSEKAYPGHPNRHHGDIDLAEKSYAALERFYKGKQYEFMHGHFSVEDLISSGDETVIFSNLFWKYRAPLFDAVFGYHWFMFELNHVADISPDMVEDQRKLWLDEIFSIEFIAKSEENIRLVKAVLLERAVAGFILDSLLIDPSKPISGFLTESCRDQAKKLIEEVSLPG